MAAVTKAPSSNAAVTTGWTNPTNAQSATADGVYATASPAKNATVNSDFIFSFALSDFVGAAQASDVNIDQIVCTVQWKVSTTASIATLGVTLRDRNLGANLGTETVDSSEPTTDTAETQTITSGITADRLISGFLAARVRATRGGSNTAFTASLDFVKVDVSYSLAAINNDSASGTITLVGSSTEALSAADVGSGSVLLGGSGVDSFAPGGTNFTDSGGGTLSLLGTAIDRLTSSSTASGTLSLSGSSASSLRASDSGSGSVRLTGTATDSFSAPILHTDSNVGLLVFSGTSTDTYSPPSGADPIIIQKLGTSGTAVMQKAGVGWTYITQKTGTSATAVAQKAITGWTQVKGH